MGRNGHLQTRQAEHDGDDRDCGDDLAALLEKGVQVARRHGYNWIIVDWWD